MVKTFGLTWGCHFGNKFIKGIDKYRGGQIKGLQFPMGLLWESRDNGEDQI
jgi:hypothetical protein